ncbi:spoIIIJ-associated protein [Acetoanaerobium noterae]|jgi:spoIIIJ-associated protein|uniref:RNA-binding protein KhpB n=3 Tax=root TaxID=1 RepID=E3PVZ8_ACESD|nr:MULTISPECIES: RNA-binding cell elongation regulator Jag/EloR [Acetoanaerobium]MBP8762517.1 protein jag [Acetoanaerobium sp.]MBP9499668.1 protein jag [Acetoanaerobium sp.]MBP9562228.1 protein jag [Acetoanaerobium sp.]CBH22701.1 SpoIIIJ-associated protein [Acetoanaerobium sticklandii]SKB65817.1 spoIIIJ-associated protein [Acetoanaerobium noterae]
MKFVEIIGKTKEEAIQKAVDQLGTPVEDLEIEVLEEGSKGLFGFLGSKDFKIKATVIVKDTVETRILSFLNGLFEVMNIEADIKIDMNSDSAKVSVIGDSAGQLIGRRGESLDALQMILSLAVNKTPGEYVKIMLDIEDYRSKREESLVRYANKMARTAAKQRKNIKLEPMNPYERRIVHSALQSDTYVTTYSEGEEPYRKVVIAVKR